MAASTSSSTVIFVDSSVADYQSLIDNRDAGTEVVVLDAARDGIAQITEYLAGRHDISSVQIVSHGAAGLLQLGSTTLTNENLKDYATQIQSWSSALTDNADILLFGCNVAADGTGHTFVQELAHLTGADLAASTDLTGNAAQGGDWVLEYATGEIESSLGVTEAGLAQFDSVLAAFGAGNLVVLRVGNGTDAPPGRMMPVFLDEYTVTGQLVQTIAIPAVDTGSNQGMTLPNHRFNNGMLNLSADGHYLTFGGWDLAVGSFSVSSPWVVALVDGGGNVDTTTVLPHNGDLSSVMSLNGTQFWLGSSNTNVTGNVQYAEYGNPASVTQITATNGDIRALDIFDGQLYASSDQVGARPIKVIGTGIPETATTAQVLPGLENSFVRNGQEFAFLDLNATVAGVDTLYVATLTGINKFSFNGTVWTARGTYSIQNTANWLGLTARTNANGVELFAVRGSGLGNQLIQVTDTANFNANFTAGASQTLVIASPQTSFRGLAFTPTLPVVSVQVLDAVALETGAANTAIFRIERTTLAGDMTVQLALAGTASTLDYVLDQGAIANSILTVVIPAGQQFIDVVLTTTEDSEVEGNESVTLTLDAAGTYQIAPNAATGALTIIDNRLPVGTPDTVTGPEESQLTGNVLTNDADADGNPLEVSSWTWLTAPSGQLVLNTDGTFTYNPIENFNGTVQFAYTLTDGFGESAPVTVTLNVTPVDDEPVPVANVYNLNEDTPLTVGGLGVLANDQNVDGDVLTAEVVDGVDNGTLLFNTNGTFTYTPNANFNGTDRFTYRVSDDGRLNFSQAVTVTLNVAPVNDNPLALADRYSMRQGTVLQVGAATGVLRNDRDPENASLSARLVANPTHGTLTFNANGAFVYRPNAGFSGVDRFSYQASDGAVSSQPTVVTIEVDGIHQNQAPQVGRPIANQVAWEDRAFSFRLPANTFVDPNGDRLRYAARQANGAALPNWLRFNAATQQFIGTPRNGNVGTLQVRVFAIDASGASTSDLFQLQVNNTNDAPRLSRTPSNVAALVGRRFSVRLPGNTFVDVDRGDRLTYQARLTNGRPLPAWLRFNPGNLSFQGLPVAGSEGTYRIQLVARDRLGAPAASILTLRVRSNQPINAIPNPANRILGTAFRDSDSVRGTNEGDRINGLGQDDYIRGFGGDDLLMGADGNDVLDGGIGNDWLMGGTGHDTLFGNQGRDVFVLGQGEGTDLIADFQQGMDRIALTGGASFANLQIVPGAGGAELRLNNEVLARLSGVQANLLTQADVISV